MSNQDPELEAYALDALPPSQRHAVEARLAGDPAAAAEVERLRTVIAALQRLPEEDPPRRIAFVSDRDFAPKWRRLYWNLIPQWGLAAAAMLAVSILAHGWLARPPAAPPAVGPQPLEIEARIAAEVARRVEAAMQQARAELKSAADAQSRQLVAQALEQAEKRFALERQADRAAMQASFELLRKQMNRMLYLASTQPLGDRP